MNSSNHNHNEGIILKVIIGIVVPVFCVFLTYFLTNASNQANVVNSLSTFFDVVDENMSYEQALQAVYEDYKNIKDENIKLQEQLNISQDLVNIENKNKEVIETVNSFIADENYEKALSILNNVDEKTPEMELLLVDVTGKYETQIIDKVNNLLSEEAYDEAIKTVDYALKILPNSNELISKKERIIAERPQNFMVVCEPYETSYNYKKYVNGETFRMSGQDRTNGFTIMGYDNQALSNLNGEYRKLTFDVGHIDGAEMIDAKLSIYLDGEFYESYDILSDALPISITVPLEGKKQIKFFIEDGRSVAMYSTEIGFADMIIQ